MVSLPSGMPCGKQIVTTERKEAEGEDAPEGIQLAEPDAITRNLVQQNREPVQAVTKTGKDDELRSWVLNEPRAVMLFRRVLKNIKEPITVLLLNTLEKFKS